MKNLTGNNQKIRTFAGSWYHHGHGCLTAYFPVHLLLFDQVKKRLFIFFSLGLLLFCGTSTTISWAEYNFYTISILYILNCPPFPSQKIKSVSPFVRSGRMSRHKLPSCLLGKSFYGVSKRFSLFKKFRCGLFFLFWSLQEEVLVVFVD